MMSGVERHRNSHEMLAAKTKRDPRNANSLSDPRYQQSSLIIGRLVTHQREVPYDSQVYFVLSLLFVDRWSFENETSSRVQRKTQRLCMFSG